MKCFFISPIGQPDTKTRQRSDEVIKYILNPVLSSTEYTLIRGDEMPKPSLITLDIIPEIIHSELVIADLTDHNPNVFYELAIRHSHRKPAILLIQEDQTIPFDISDMRVIPYRLDLKGAEKAKNLISAQLKEIISNPNDSYNPISVSEQIYALNTNPKSSETDKQFGQILSLLYTLSSEFQTIIDTETNAKEKLNDTKELSTEFFPLFFETLHMLDEYIIENMNLITEEVRIAQIPSDDSNYRCFTCEQPIEDTTWIDWLNQFEQASQNLAHMQANLIATRKQGFMLRKLITFNSK